MAKPTVIFILGGPGSGKGTQSELIQKNFGFTHLSAGDLLRAQRKKQGSENGALIEKYIVQGKIVPSQITVRLLQQAMQKKGWENGKFLIDGFPRNKQNLGQWLNLMNDKVNNPFIVYLDCSQQVMLQRLVKRSETSGRSDDNEEVIKKRFNTYREETVPVIKEYQKDDRVVRVESVGSVEAIFAQLKESFHKRGVN